MAYDERMNATSVRYTTTNSTMDGGPKSEVYAMVKPMLENTAAHGIPNIVRAESTPRRVAWSFLFVVALCCFIGLSGNLIRKYYSFDYNVNVEVLFEPAINFPAVTLCNMNPFRQSSVVNASLELTEILGLGNDPMSKWNSSTNALVCSSFLIFLYTIS